MLIKQTDGILIKVQILLFLLELKSCMVMDKCLYVVLVKDAHLEQ
jgi:hypothetical protein